MGHFKWLILSHTSIGPDVKFVKVGTPPIPLPNLGHLLCSKYQIGWLGHNLPPTKNVGWDILHFWSYPPTPCWDNVLTLGLWWLPYQDQVCSSVEEFFKYEYPHLHICEQYRKHAATGLNHDEIKHTSTNEWWNI